MPGGRSPVQNRFHSAFDPSNRSTFGDTVCCHARLPPRAFEQHPWSGPDSKENVMASILVLNSSVLGNGSVSKVLVEEAVHRLLEVSPGATIIHRDLGA